MMSGTIYGMIVMAGCFTVLDMCWLYSHHHMHKTAKLAMSMPTNISIISIGYAHSSARRASSYPHPTRPVEYSPTRARMAGSSST